MEGEQRFQGASDEEEHPIERQRRAAAARGFDVDEFASFHAEEDAEERDESEERDDEG
jgi:hypothetical protein